MPPLNSIIQGDTLSVLKSWPDEFVDLIMTSPPYYALRNYGVNGQLGLESNFEEYQEKLLAIIAEVKRVLKPSGQFWLNMGDIYGGTRWSGGEVGQPINKFRDGYRDINPQRNFKPSTQSDRMYKNAVGMGKASDGSKCLSMMPERIAIKMCDEQNWILRNRICWAKQILDFKQKMTKGSVMPSSVKDRFNESWEYLYFFVKNKKYYSDLDAVRLSPQTFENRPDGIIREREFGYDTEYPEVRKSFNYRVRDAKRKSGQPQFKVSKEEISKYAKGSEYEQKYGEPWDRFGKNTKKAKIVKFDISKRQKELVDGGAIGSTQRVRGFYDEFGGQNNPLGKNLPTVFLIGSEPHNFQKELGSEIDHFAIFPQALVEIPIKFGCPPKGLVADIFMGSGTTAVVARSLGRDFLGIEINPEYIKLAERRLSQQLLPL